MDEFESKAILSESDAKSMLLEHEAKLRNLRLTILDFLFDANLKNDIMILGNIAIDSPQYVLDKIFAKKYTKHFTEKALSPEDLNDYNNAKAKGEPFRNQKSVAYELDKDLAEARKLAESMLPMINDMLECIELSKLSQPYRVLPPK